MKEITQEEYKSAVSYDEKTGVFVRKKKTLGRGMVGKCISLGCFSDKFNAVAVRKSAEIKYKFHVNHGRVQ